MKAVPLECGSNPPASTIIKYFNNMDFKYNYVVFNYPDTKGLRMDNPDGYYAICLEDLKQDKNVIVVNYPLEGKKILLKLLYRLFASFKSRTKNSKLACSLIKVIYPLYYPNLVQNNKKFCFVFISDIWDIGFMRYLKKKYPSCIIIMALRDLVKTKWFYNELNESGLVDHWMSYDEGDCKKFNMTYFSEFESKINVADNSSVESSDVFFTGRAKQRLPKLIECYDHLTSLGQKCLFIILDAPEDQKVEREGIIYTNSYMTYRRMLEYSIRSKCLLDINQEGATGYTSRFLEAIIYNKLLLTNSIGVSKHPLYDERFIQEFKSITEVKPSFFEDKGEVKYNYNNEFSPIHFIEIIDKTF